MFIYEENASGIKRWTDGVTWSPSRILGNFLVYRELDKPFPPGEKKRAMKKQQRRPSRPGEPYARTSDVGSYSDNQPSTFPPDHSASAEVERQLIGSLVDSYGFKNDGLVKKTMSVTVGGVTHHLVSYYHVNDVLTNQLRTPGQTENLQYIRPRAELTQKQSFRAPIDEADDVEGTQNAYAYRMNPSGYAQPPYYMPQSYPPVAQQSNPPHYPMGVPSMSASYSQSPVSAPHLQGQRNDYSQYEGGYNRYESGYNRSYESLNNSITPTSRSIPPTPTTTAPMMSDRSQTQSATYPPMNMQRPSSNLSPLPVDSRNTVPYRPNPYPVTHPSASQMDQSRQSQPSPEVKYEDRREMQQQHQMYQTSRSPYYPEGASQAIPQPQYSQQPQMGQWAGQSHGA